MVRQTSEIQGLPFSEFLNLTSNFLILIVGGWSWNWVHSARQPFLALYLPRVVVRMENLVEWRSAWETEVFGENMPQRHFVPPRWKPVTNRSGYGAAYLTDTSGRTQWTGGNFVARPLCMQESTNEASIGIRAHIPVFQRPLWSTSDTLVSHKSEAPHV
jgi:hypothetical protein